MKITIKMYDELDHKSRAITGIVQYILSGGLLLFSELTKLFCDIFASFGAFLCETITIIILLPLVFNINYIMHGLLMVRNKTREKWSAVPMKNRDRKIIYNSAGVVLVNMLIIVCMGGLQHYTCSVRSREVLLWIAQLDRFHHFSGLMAWAISAVIYGVLSAVHNYKAACAP